MLQHVDHWIGHPEGRLFARVWAAGTAPGAARAAPIILFHDSLGCVALWRDFPALLASKTGRVVIAYDRLGFGCSDARGQRPGLDFIAEEAVRYFPAVVAHFALPRFALLGHSVGGGMAVCCAATHGSACAALVTLSAQAFVEEQTRSGILAAERQLRQPDQADRLARHHGDKAAWVLDAWTGVWLDPAFADWSLASTLPAVQCPLLAIHGDHDEYGSRNHPEMLGRLCAGPAQVEILAAAGHLPHREDPQGVATLIETFLRGVP